MRNHIRSVLEALVKFGIAFAILYWLYSQGHLRFDFVHTLLAHPLVLVACLFLTFVSLYFNNERWRLLLHDQNMIYSRWATGRLTLIGLFFNFAMPGGVGGDIIKSFYLTRNHVSEKTKSIMTVLMDRLIGLHSILILGSVSMWLDITQIWSLPELKIVFLIVFLGTIAFTVITLAFLSHSEKTKKIVELIISLLPLKHRFLKIYHTFNSYGRHKKTLLLAYIYSFISQSLAIIFMYMICTLTYGVTINPHSFFIVVPIGFILTALPISPAGVGVGQAAFLYLFKIYSPEHASLGPSALTAWQASLLLFGLIGGGLYLLNRAEIKTAQTLSESQS